ncbi:MAG: hypothetical protein HY017_09120 [Betaproteobacteria bacterium]|nr:hypothetical protein [Betaproteobacteria bacterium]
MRVDWNGHKLGCVPRIQNHALAQLLDRGHRAHRGAAGEPRSVAARAIRGDAATLRGEPRDARNADCGRWGQH